MKPTIVAKGVKLSSRLREYVAHRLGLTLDRAHYGIQTLKVRITDQNGPKGGVDKHCQIHLTMAGFPTVMVTEKGSDIPAMVDLAAQRAAQSVDRLLARTKAIRRVKFSPRTEAVAPLAKELLLNDPSPTGRIT
ncbi:HPF/RaiA family ribosome-associated protein [Glaciimonas immobilis]|uniref:Ribosome-associated translation inhibitor RaiA n=1 Tax=Glaciimonas immobilis TaxID=728004 RepID=A0A840RSG3_9BURK|nr:HPF/RaiA family ribosome-associated protein [Glaciimonas immobilis]KAF3997099.1 HPF/RaiA family ribosome-associated protein [Glaciimonas immobilis]MBB5199958.1 ribosome-associated translation inhibitor RaiA [Glaciimonas immobilis]